LKIHTFEELARIYSSGGLHPLDLKNGVAEALVELLNPVRQFFKRKPENYERMKSLTITR
jgi:tyrosyl-tRNA synthetase